MVEQLQRLSAFLPKPPVLNFNSSFGLPGGNEKKVAGYTRGELEARLRNDYGLGNDFDPIISDGLMDRITSENTALAPLNAWKGSDGRWHLQAYLWGLFATRGVAAAPAPQPVYRPPSATNERMVGGYTRTQLIQRLQDVYGASSGNSDIEDAVSRLVRNEGAVFAPNSSWFKSEKGDYDTITVQRCWKGECGDVEKKVYQYTKKLYRDDYLNNLFGFSSAVTPSSRSASSPSQSDTPQPKPQREPDPNRDPPAVAAQDRRLERQQKEREKKPK